jgi:hypothetical protein
MSIHDFFIIIGMIIVGLVFPAVVAWIHEKINKKKR